MTILKLLNSSVFTSGEAVARALKISRSAVHKRINMLRAKGYSIIGGSNQGYLLVSKPDLLIPEELESHLSKQNSLVKKINYCTTVNSTQTVAKDAAIKGSSHGTLFIAEKQSNGYGRVQRQWASPEGGIWFSIILRPKINPDKVPAIALVISLSLAEAIERITGLKPLIKWPNDIMLNGKKLAGILVEMSAEIGRVNWIVAGIGINVNNKIPEPLKGKAISLCEVTGANVNRAMLLGAILTSFQDHYKRFLLNDFSHFREIYNRRSFLKNKKVTVLEGETLHQGLVEGVDPNGYLALRLKDGNLKKIVSGDLIKIQK
jgi:BirA family transcriptional regulator, biotin operon repressor / biotin---[acetyl-CoA-carboxylase] ligase